MNNITCVCCKADSGQQGVGNILDTQKVSGYSYVLNVGNGLSAEWVCPACKAILVPLVEVIVNMFGDKVSHLHFGSLVKWVKEH